MNKMNKYKKSQTSQKQELVSKPYEIIYELLSCLNENLSDAVKNIDKGKNEEAREKAKKAQNIAFALQSCLDFKEGGEIAQSLYFLYSHIKFATKNYVDTEKSDLLSSAYFVSNEILDGWKGMNSSVA
jgi:flagellin-specific chaperone FliS